MNRQPRPYGLNPTFLAQVIAWVLVTKHGHDPYSSSQMPLPLPFFMRVELARPMRLEYEYRGSIVNKGDMLDGTCSA